MDASAKTRLAEGLRVAASGGFADAASASSASASSASDWYFPLMLSCMAGASTCVGAAVVFCFEASRIRKAMAFSLSLAAAVMVTISLVSILPEVCTGILVDSEQIAATADNYDFLLPWSKTNSMVRTRLLLERLLSLGMGLSAYLLLSKLLVFLPDPEHLHFLSGGGGTNNDDDDDDDEAFNKRNDYDLYLFPNNDSSETNNSDAMEKGDLEQSRTRIVATDRDKVRRRTKRPTTNNSNSNSNNMNKNMRRAPSNETLSLSGTSAASSDDIITEDIHSLLAATKEQRKRSWRVTVMLFVSLLVHNFPEGLCVAASAKESPELGITVAIGIFIHNVPEGIAISVPCIAAKPDRPWLAFWLASFSGLAEPLGAIVALTMLGRTKLDLENVLAFVAGVMTAVAVWELYPEAWKANEEELKHQHQQYYIETTTTSLSWKQLLSMTLLRKEYRPILWGTVAGTSLMVVTELCLP